MRRVRRTHPPRSPQLHCPAHPLPVARSHHRQGPSRRPPRGPASLHPLREGHFRAARRPHACRVAERLAGRQFLARRRHQGYLGARRQCHRGKRFYPARRARNRCHRSPGLMLSRVADSIYWMSRYVERAENVARFIDVNLNLMLDAPDGSARQWEPLVNTTGDHEDFAERCGQATQQNVIHFLTFDPDNSNSIISCLRAARENARSVREIISSEMWLQLNKFYLMVNEAACSKKGLESPPA